MEIRNIGSLQQIDKNGFIVNCAIFPVAQHEYVTVVADIKSLFVEIFKSDTHSLYLRGSVAKGDAIPFISDVDTVAVLKVQVTEEHKKMAQLIHEQVCAKYPFVKRVELLLKDVKDEHEMWLKFLLKTKCVCIYGNDLLPGIAPFKIGKDAYIHLTGILKTIDGALEELKEDMSADDTKDLCTWIMKAIIRSGFELVMERDNSYTRDLYPNYAIFSKYYPQHEAEMKNILRLALDPTTDKSTITTVISNMRSFFNTHHK